MKRFSGVLFLLACTSTIYAAPLDKPLTQVPHIRMQGCDGGTIVPGRSVGQVRLGATRAEVRKRLGKPVGWLHRGNHITQDTWLGPVPANDKDGNPVSERTYFKVIYRNQKVIQIEFNSPQFVTAAGGSVRKNLAQFRARHKNLRVRAYAYIEPEGGGYVGYYYDDVRKGIAFTFGTQDSFNAQVTPEALRVHRPGTPVLPDPGGVPAKAEDEVPIGS